MLLLFGSVFGAFMARTARRSCFVGSGERIPCGTIDSNRCSTRVVSSERDGQFVSTVRLEEGRTDGSVPGVGPPLPPYRESGCRPHGCEASSDRSKVTGRLSDIVEERSLYQGWVAIDAAGDLICMALIFVTLAKEDPCQVATKHGVDLILLRRGEWFRREETSEATREVPDLAKQRHSLAADLQETHLIEVGR